MQGTTLTVFMMQQTMLMQELAKKMGSRAEDQRAAEKAETAEKRRPSLAIEDVDEEND